MNRWSPKRYAKIVIHAGSVLIGYGIFLASKTTPYFAYRSMSSLFCLTGGRSNDVLSWLIGKVRRPYIVAPLAADSGLMESTECSKAVSSVREYGYHVFEKPLPQDVCGRLLQFALTQPSLMRPIDQDPDMDPISTIYRRNSPQAVRYDFDAKSLLANHDVQNIVADPSLLALAQDYLQAKPMLDIVTMWWHTDFLDRPDSRAAQYFHFDMDRPKWIKFFFFLTDVLPTSGPHMFVSGSHKTGAIPDDLLIRGQVRLSDEEVDSAFEANRIIEFAVPRGTVVAEDTRGLHKGKHVESGDRLILQLQFSNSLFGMAYPAARIAEPVCESLSRSMMQYPGVYAAYR